MLSVYLFPTISCWGTPRWEEHYIKPGKILLSHNNPKITPVETGSLINQFSHLKAESNLRSSYYWNPVRLHLYRCYQIPLMWIGSFYEVSFQSQVSRLMLQRHFMRKSEFLLKLNSLKKTYLFNSSHCDLGYRNCSHCPLISGLSFSCHPSGWMQHTLCMMLISLIWESTHDLWCLLKYIFTFQNHDMIEGASHSAKLGLILGGGSQEMFSYDELKTYMLPNNIPDNGQIYKFNTYCVQSSKNTSDNYLMCQIPFKVLLN